MAEPRELAHPPITEALIDIRIGADTAITAAQLTPLRDELRELFPKAKEQRQMKGEFRVEAGKLLPPTSLDLGVQGLRLEAEDGHRIVQFRRDGFTFNNIGLGYYLGGEALIGEALSLWSRYAQVIRPTSVVRVAMRYLNRLDLPFRDGDQFTRFLVAPPELPTGAPQLVSSFLSRIVAHDGTGAQAIVTQKLNVRPDPPGAVILDLDIFYPLSEGIEPTENAIRPYLEKLRILKNQTFFSLLTEEAVKLYL
jgi:uncharacterized protein (TIGR04255 family)